MKYYNNKILKGLLVIHRLIWSLQVVGIHVSGLLHYSFVRFSRIFNADKQFWHWISLKNKIKVHLNSQYMQDIASETALNEGARRKQRFELQSKDLSWGCSFSSAACDMVFRASASKIGCSCDFLKLHSVVISSEAQVWVATPGLWPAPHSSMPCLWKSAMFVPIMKIMTTRKLYSMPCLQQIAPCLSCLEIWTWET